MRNIRLGKGSDMRTSDHDGRDRSAVVSTLIMLTCLVLGLLAGGMLVIGVSFVSFWKSLSPSEFQAWFASYSHLIGRLMIPLGVAGVVLAVVAVVVRWRDSRRERRWLFISAAAVVGVMLTYPLVFAATNEAFVRGSLADPEARALLGWWATWHWVRTAIGTLGFFAALRALGFPRS